MRPARAQGTRLTHGCGEAPSRVERAGASIPTIRCEDYLAAVPSTAPAPIMRVGRDDHRRRRNVDAGHGRGWRVCVGIWISIDGAAAQEHRDECQADYPDHGLHLLSQSLNVLPSETDHAHIAFIRPMRGR